jgi:ABC-type nitrate/sulfonate/bicarbonate transport system ATPase subunit
MRLVQRLGGIASFCSVREHEKEASLQSGGSLLSSIKLELRNVGKTFHGDGMVVPALEDVSLKVEAGEFVTLIGPSGSGKSTLFTLIVGLLEPDHGEICINRTGLVGYMPQRDLLLPWRSIIDNVILPQEIHGIPREHARQKARELLPLFGLDEFSTAYPYALSGGMRQRAALLRTFLAEGDLILLDEPFGALDALTRRELQDWLLSVWQQFGQTILFITHDVEEALYLGDRVIVLSSRPGSVRDDLNVSLPRPRRQGMVAQPEFGQQVARLLNALGVRT